MNRLFLSFSAATLMLRAESAVGRIGETKPQVEARYAASGFFESHDALGNEQRVYQFLDFIVAVSFQKGKSVCETFMMREGAPAGPNISLRQIESILGANEPTGETWKTRIESVSWETSDGTLKAINLFGRLQVSTTEYGARMRALHHKQERWR